VFPLKPGNVLLHDGHGKLSDLGLSQLLTPGLTITGILLMFGPR